MVGLYVSVAAGVLQTVEHTTGLISRQLPLTRINPRTHRHTHPHQTLMHHCEELGELASSLGGRPGESLSDVAGARGAAYAAGRCYYVAHTYLAGGKAPEAAALFGRCVDSRVEEAREKLEVGGVWLCGVGCVLSVEGGGVWEGGKMGAMGQLSTWMTCYLWPLVFALAQPTHSNSPNRPQSTNRICPRSSPPRAPHSPASPRWLTRRAHGAWWRLHRQQQMQQRRGMRLARALPRWGWSSSRRLVLDR